MSSARRRSTLRSRDDAADLSVAPKSLELEQRIARLEGSHRDIMSALEQLIKRTTALQAQLDHLAAKLSRFG